MFSLLIGTCIKKILLPIENLILASKINCKKIFAYNPWTLILFCPAPVLGGGMTKKKRKSDPNAEKSKDERRKKRVAKALKKMQKKERQPKPLIECEVGESQDSTIV